MFNLGRYVACIAEGSAETAILFDHGKRHIPLPKRSKGRRESG